MRIESLQNPRVKRILNLQQKAKARKQEGVFVVEGLREVERALLSGFELLEIWSDKNIPKNLPLPATALVVDCSTPVFEKLTYREAAADVLALFATKETSLEKLKLPANPLIIVLETVEKPGNIGAVLRTANALGAHAVFLCNSVVDVYNPNVIRNSLGGFFNIPIISTSTSKAIAFIKANNISIITTHLKASVDYLQVDYKKPVALIFGSEANGLSQEWVENTSQNVIIEMGGVVDSLNISVAVSIVLAEAVRQRKV